MILKAEMNTETYLDMLVQIIGISVFKIGIVVRTHSHFDPTFGIDR